MLRSLGQRPVTGSDEDPRVAELRTAVSRLRRELAAHPAEFPDRGIAEDELAALAAMALSGMPEIPRLRRSLLLIAGAIGSVSALATGLRAYAAPWSCSGNRPGALEGAGVLLRVRSRSTSHATQCGRPASAPAAVSPLSRAVMSRRTASSSTSDGRV